MNAPVTTRNPVRKDPAVSAPTAAENKNATGKPSVLVAPLLALAAGNLLWLCYFPMAWSPLAWVALVPLLGLVRTQTRPVWLYLWAWIGGVVFFFPILNWMAVADHRDLYAWLPLALYNGLLQFLAGDPLRMFYCWLLLAFYCSLYVPLALWLTRRLVLRLNLPLLLAAPFVWVTLDFFRSFVLSGFAWYYLGHTQHDFLALIQITDITGVYGVTALVVLVNALLVEWLYLIPGVRRVLGWPEPAWAEIDHLAGRRQRWTLVVFGLLLTAIIYGGWRLGQETMQPGPRLALLQGNLDQRLRNQASASGESARQARQRIMRGYDDLCWLAANQEPRPDLIVWPETSFPYEWVHISRDMKGEVVNLIPQEWIQADAANLKSFRLMAEKYRTNLLLGLNRHVLLDVKKMTEPGPNGQMQEVTKTREQRFNAALLVHAGGSTGGVYDKVHRVPFGEYVPLRDWLPWMNKLSPYDFDYSISAGEKLMRFELPGRQVRRFGVLVCYEDTDPELARRYAVATRDGPGVDFLLNISNEGWFDGSSEHEEHLAISRFRAIEARRAIARAVNMGISGIIDSNGRVLQPVTRRVPDQLRPLVGPLADIDIWEVPAKTPTDLSVSNWHNYKKDQAIVLATIPIDTRLSLYAIWGDAFAWLCSAGVLAGFIASFRGRLCPAGKEK